MVKNNEDAFQSGTFFSDVSRAGICAVDTVRCHINLIKEGYSLPDTIKFLRNFKPRFSEPLFAKSEKKLESVLEMICGETFPIETASSKAQAAPCKSSKPDLAVLTAFLKNFGWSICTQQPDRKLRRK